MASLLNTILSHSLALSTVVLDLSLIIVSVLALAFKGSSYTTWFDETYGGLESSSGQINVGIEVYHISEYPDTLELRPQITVYVSAGLGLFMGLVTTALVVRSLKVAPVQVRLAPE
jgi:hypothetical protein